MAMFEIDGEKITTEEAGNGKITTKDGVVKIDGVEISVHRRNIKKKSESVGVKVFQKKPKKALQN